MTVEDLYPFLYGEHAQESDSESILAHVRRSTAEKAAEIVALRARLAEELGGALEAAAAAMAARFSAGGRLFTFGNGGSATDAADVAALFLGPPRGRPLPALALSNPVAVLTALANDVGFEVVFARQLGALAGPNDIAYPQAQELRRGPGPGPRGVRQLRPDGAGQQPPRRPYGDGDRSSRRRAGTGHRAVARLHPQG